MMLHCGWGIGEFFEWNRAENWEAARITLQAYPPPEYYRFEFEGRKSNDQPFHTLIPTFALTEIFDSKTQFPLRTAGSHELNLANYHNSKVSVDAAFKTALKRARINPAGHLSPHDLRDVFRTQATIQGVDYDAREFSLGYTIDPRGYDKCYANLPWLWRELSKIYKQPSTEGIKNMAKENEELRTELTKQNRNLQTQIEELQLAVQALQDATHYKVNLPQQRVT
jgi:hypothetical protein